MNELNKKHLALSIYNQFINMSESLKESCSKSYEKIIKIIDKPIYDDEDIFKEGLKYLLRFDSKPSKIYHIS